MVDGRYCSAAFAHDVNVQVATFGDGEEVALQIAQGKQFGMDIRDVVLQVSLSLVGFPASF
jgi:citrate lyase gamma subunit